jgi:hypothetical protein
MASWTGREGKLARVNEEKGNELGAKLDELRAHVLERLASHLSPILVGQSEGSRKSGAILPSDRTGSVGASAELPIDAAGGCTSFFVRVFGRLVVRGVLHCCAS